MSLGDSQQWRDSVFHLLSNRRRRYALHYCLRADSPVSVSELADRVTAWENGKAVEDITSDERKTVYTSLTQTHLDAMDEAGIVEYDHDTVEATAAAEELAVYMEIVPGNSIPWAEYYLGLSAVSAAVLGLTWLNVYPVSPFVVGAVLVCLFAASAAVHAYRRRRRTIGARERPPSARLGGESDGIA